MAKKKERKPDYVDRVEIIEPIQLEIINPQPRYLGSLNYIPNANIGDYFFNKVTGRAELLTENGRNEFYV